MGQTQKTVKSSVSDVIAPRTVLSIESSGVLVTVRATELVMTMKAIMQIRATIEVVLDQVLRTPTLPDLKHQQSNAIISSPRMEGLATAASVAGVIQLVGSVRKLYEFWDSIKDAPEEIRAIALDLRLLLSVLAEIASDAQHAEPDQTLEAVMEACHFKVKALNAIVNEIEPNLVSSSSLVKKWAAVKGVLKAKKINKFRDSLGELKITLMLERQTQNE
ncbi:MAG: hypothetical protein Q9191_008190 [Dirinaria sp. TL-2023a]